MYHLIHIPSPMGEIYLEAKDECLTGIWIDGQGTGESIKVGYEESENVVLHEARLWMESYLRGENPELSRLPFSLDENVKGSAFAKCIWKLLCEIPYGEVVTYGDIAKKAAMLMGKERMSAQAVGGAVGSNPLAIVVPCHRVVGANYNLTGYGGGLDKKVWLLAHEGIAVDKYHMPK